MRETSTDYSVEAASLSFRHSAGLFKIAHRTGKTEKSTIESENELWLSPTYSILTIAKHSDSLEFEWFLPSLFQVL